MYNKLYIFVLVPFLLFHIINAEERSVNKNKTNLNKPLILSGNNFDGNRIDCDMRNNGQFVTQAISGRSGLSWPKGNGTQTIYASGVWLGGIIDSEIRVSAGEYGGEFASGPWGANHDDEQYKIYKVNKSDLSYPQNSDDFQNWPVDLGAPWVDNNNNGTYEPLPKGPDHPEFIGDQVLWMVMNDGIDTLHTIFNSDPMGFEIQRTVFGFDRADEYGDMMFIKDLIINRGDNTIEDMYIGLWSDPDLGDAADDFVGCDTTLGMGICYNDGYDYNFNVLGTPAVGYDFFQGPIVPAQGETAYMFGRDIPNMKNLKMTSFVKYIGADPVYYDPNNAEEAYNYMKGLMPNGILFPASATGGTPYIHPGDPTKDVGPNDTEYVDADLHSSDDRRFLMSSGPFTMTPGDSQEVVYAIINAADGTWDQSYLKLKEVDIMAQRAYDGHFISGETPPSPNVEVTELEEEIILTWDDEAESYESEDMIDVIPETFETTKYSFEGYNVYQLENIDGTGEILKIATYDIINDVKIIMDDVFDSNYGVNVNVPVQNGTDSGIQRSVKIDHNYFNNSRLTLNREYYFLVTAYGYNEYGSPKTLESSMSDIIIVRPQVPNQWEANEDIAYGTVIEAEHSAGNGDGFVYVRVVDPTKITGDDYKITFNDQLIEGDSSISVTNWNLINITTGEELLSNQLIINGKNQLTDKEESEEANAIVDGLQFIVNGPVPSIKWLGVVQNAGGPLDPPQDGLPYWRYPDWNVLGDGNPDYLQQTNGATWFFNVSPAYGNSGVDLFNDALLGYSGGLGHPMQGIGALIPYDFELRFTEAGGLAYDNWDGGGNIPVPFEWWNVGINTPDDPSDDYRLIPWLLDDDGSGDWNLTATDDPTSGGSNDPITDRIYVHAPTNDTPGQQGYDDFFANADPAGSNINAWYGGAGGVTGPTDTWNVLSRSILMNWNGGDVTYPTFPAKVNALEPEQGTVWRIVTTKPNNSDDEFFFSTDTLVGKTLDYNPKSIKVWPNPYFGYNPEETGYYDRQIHFTHLPEEGECTIRIFDLAGTLVTKIEHTNGTQFEIWNLTNDYYVYVASGMYIVHIETEEGEKILKLAVIQPS